MRYNTLYLTIAILCSMICLPHPGLAEMTGWSELYYDDSTNQVIADYWTDLDYSSSYYYDLQVQGYLFETSGRGFLSDTGLGFMSTGPVSVGTQATAIAGQTYLAHGNHKLKVYFRYVDIDPDCDMWCSYYYDSDGYSLVAVGETYPPPYITTAVWWPAGCIVYRTGEQIEEGSSNTEKTIPSVSVNAGPNSILAHASGADAPASTFVTITAAGSPSGGNFTWTTSSQKVTLSNANSPTVTVTSQPDQYSTSVGDVPIQVVYTFNGEPSKPATTTITVLKPVSLSRSQSDANGTHTCVAGEGSSNCTQSYYEDTPIGRTYSSYLLTVRYRTNSNIAGMTIPYNMHFEESYVNAPAGTITGTAVTAELRDDFYYCSQVCRQGGSEQVTGTQTINANGFPVATKNIIWTCTGAIVP
ncbi:MAG: hypothetical protein LLG20_13060 [Acidobacteriales bacterium]|nr:hypothetical protein [Terriglobales bacterium]